MKNTNNVPRLRFPKFTDDWERRKVTELGEIYIGLVTTMTSHYTDHGALLIRNSDIKDGRFEFGDNPIYLDDDFAKQNFSRKHIVGDVITVHTGDIGTSAVITEKEAGSIGFATIVTRPNTDKILSDYLCSYLNTDAHKKFAINISTGDGRNNYNLKDYYECVVPVPSIAEQRKISECIKNVNFLITLHQRKCDKLEEYKKAMLQKIFSQELRFKREDGTEYSEWEEKKFGTTVLIERGGSPRPIKQYITNGDGYNWVKIGDAPEHGNYITHTEEKIKKSGLNKTRQVFKGDLILSNSMSFGKPYIMAIDGCIHDGWLLIRNNQNIYNLKFLCYLLGTDYMLKQYKSLAGGSTVNNLNKELVSMTTVSVPCLEEQQKIADFLSALDEAISYAKQELDKWKELKKGLLQQMFV